MFTRTRFESGVAPGSVRLETWTVSRSPGRAGRLALMAVWSGATTMCTFGGTASIGITMDAVSVPLVNFNTAGPVGSPTGTTNVTWFGFDDRIVAVRSLTVIAGLEKFEPERITAAPG